MTVQPSEYALELLRQDDQFILYRGRPAAPDVTGILMLAPASSHPGPDILRRIEHEYSLRGELDPEWAAQPLALSQYNGQQALVFRDPGGEPLDRLCRAQIELTRFVRIAIGLAAALTRLHQRQLIHKDIKPSNILIDSGSDQIWLTGFGIASPVPRERQPPTAPQLIAGTLAYMAPEQTGRMNRSIDSRSDLYSMGVVLYEMLTGTLPFPASDAMELVHAHIARAAVPPHERSKDIPRALSRIVMKLLAKAAEERYQTAPGVEHDLRRCLAEWEIQDRIDDFPLAEYDLPDRLLIPEQLYGRAAEVDALLTAFNRVVAGGRLELVLVSGHSGIGKSSVVNELHKALVPPRGLFTSGKFDQYRRDVPYATLTQAFRNLLRPLLSKSDEELRLWRDALHEAVSPNGRLIADLVPELTLIIGEQPPVADVPPQDARRRFHLMFRRFLSVFARPEHPLALFLDDLQWLDAATLDLLEDLMIRPDVDHLLLIGAYRDNEVHSTHPLIRKLEAIRHAGGTVHEIRLFPLAPRDLVQLVADSLHCEPERAVSLASLIREKTGGNPFFVIQFISALVDAGLLAFNHDDRRWAWDLERIHAKGYTDNVVDLMVRKLNGLPIETSEALQQLACLGNSTEFALLLIVFRSSIDEVHAQLWGAVQAGLVTRAESSYGFLHDRVQEAAYSLIPEQRRANAHLRIGRMLAAQTPPSEREERIFDIVNQLNRGSHLMTSDDERDQLAELNLLAGRRAKNSTAYPSALTYLAMGRKLLTEETWEHNYDLIFSIERLVTECELLTGNLSAAADRLSGLAQRANNSHDVAVVTRLLLTAHTALDRSDRGVEVCLGFLRRDGRDWPLHPTEAEVRSEYDRVWAVVGSRPIEAFLDLPLLTDPVVLDALDVLSEVVTPAVFFDERLSSFLLCRMVTLSLEHGNTDASCFAYVWFAVVARSQFGNYEDAFRFGRLGYELIEKRSLTAYQARTYMSFGNLVIPSMRHALEGRDLVRQAFDAAYRNGDLTFAAYSWNQLITNFLAVGDPLDRTLQEAEKGLAFAAQARFGLVVDLLTAQVGLVRTLRGLTPQFGSFSDACLDEEEFERHLASNPVLADPEFGYWGLKVQARFLAGDYQAAVQASLKAQALLWSAPSLFEPSAYRFYSALSHAACWTSSSAEERQRHERALADHHRQFEIWAEHSPANFENRVALVAAEIARIEKRDGEAMRLYEQAIDSAHANGFVHNEAVAYEVAARFYATRGFNKFADAYLVEARYCYLRWGADGKVRQIDELYPHLRREEPMRGTSGTIVSPGELLDLATIVRVSQAVSGEMALEKLIEKVMRVALQHAGAERGLLIVPRSDDLRIEAEATISLDSVSVRTHDSAAGSAFPESLVRYVTRTREPVILGDASDSNLFSADPYIAQHRPRSVLGLPLINQGKLSGVLYLENSLTPHVFNANRITVLKVLASQAAISLENTRLYHDLENREARIRRLVDANILGILIWNVDGVIVASNEAFLSMVQSDREDVASGRVRWTEMTPPEWRDSDERALATLSKTGTVQPYEKELLRKDGSRVPVLVAGALFEEGGSEGVAFALDLTEQKRAEAEIRVLKDQLYRENLVLRDEVDRASMFEEIVGSSNALKAVLSQVAKVAPTDSTVFITGETGTGKELLARAVHKRSRRSGCPFVNVNCAALAPALISSELFGHEKGAFTGAVQRRLGRFELADGGTIFLDEVGELLPETQVALLRVLQEREFERVGGTQAVRIDIRLIAATNRDLQTEVANGTFRQDLFYRLNVFPIYAPPLRERKDDIRTLVEYFLHRYATRAGKKFRSIDKRTLHVLQLYDWPGNIRELQNVIERSVILSVGDVFSVDELWLSTESSRPVTRAESSGSIGAVPRGEREMIEAALAGSRGRVAGPSGAAAKLRIPASTLESRIKALEIRKSRFKF
jgi:PAS domain S-box-containing protein